MTRDLRRPGTDLTDRQARWFSAVEPRALRKAPLRRCETGTGLPETSFFRAPCRGAVVQTGGVYRMKRHLHLAIGLSSVLLAACCLAGAGLAWLRAAVGAVARTAMLCTVSEPAQLPEETITMATSRTTETAVPQTGFWFGATVRPDQCPPLPVSGWAAVSDTADRNPGPPGTARAGPILPGMNGTIT